MLSLLRSHDRKVTNLVSPSGKASAIRNTFGLPAGKAFSCPDATSICEKVCYAGKLERVYKGVREVLVHNWQLLKDADINQMVDLLDDMMIDFVKDCEKRNAPKLFRIHWDGDFFNQTYEYAWQKVIMMHEDVQFWCYTRVRSAAYSLSGLTNLSLYYSTDSENKHIAEQVRRDTDTKLAYLSTYHFCRCRRGDDTYHWQGRCEMSCTYQANPTHLNEWLSLRQLRALRIR